MRIPVDKYCPRCGQGMNNEVAVCPTCGAPQTPPPNPNASQINQTNDDVLYSDKDWLATLLLCLLTGALGIHRFYTGHIGIGIIQLLTGGGCGIWALIDLVMIVTGKFKDSEGRLVVEKSQR